eukprot:TRINITY_DN2194_c0_g1_i2.p2 TRINITY_DN2194_c0_g1~~TRINITY_DN2194_c0_g1_i2.p2  ORF type:complete len:290 (-),score=88.74 TRINITY_DN2194_c0_g1_i2:77-946(-)
MIYQRNKQQMEDRRQRSLAKRAAQEARFAEQQRKLEEERKERLLQQELKQADVWDHIKQHERREQYKKQQLLRKIESNTERVARMKAERQKVVEECKAMNLKIQQEREEFMKTMEKMATKATFVTDDPTVPARGKGKGKGKGKGRGKGRGGLTPRPPTGPRPDTANSARTASTVFDPNDIDNVSDSSGPDGSEYTDPSSDDAVDMELMALAAKRGALHKVRPSKKKKIKRQTKTPFSYYTSGPSSQYASESEDSAPTPPPEETPLPTEKKVYELRQLNHEIHKLLAKYG